MRALVRSGDTEKIIFFASELTGGGVGAWALHLGPAPCGVAAPCPFPPSPPPLVDPDLLHPHRPQTPAPPSPAPADVSRQREVFLLAANYLQSSGAWRASPEALATVAGFYTKAGAHGGLAAFHEARAAAAVEGPGRDYGAALQVGLDTSGCGREGGG
jgi:hypothetical protein